MYLPSMTTEELIRYADTAATTELERELVKHATALLEDCDDNDKMPDQIEHLTHAGIDLANTARYVAVSLDDDAPAKALLDAVEIFECKTENALR